MTFPRVSGVGRGGDYTLSLISAFRSMLGRRICMMSGGLRDCKLEEDNFGRGISRWFTATHCEQHWAGQFLKDWMEKCWEHF